MDNQGIEYAGDTKSPVSSETHPDKPAAETTETTTVTLTEEDNNRIKKKTDKTILSLLAWVYFLQVLDKAVLGTGAVFNLKEDLHLTGSQYSLIASISPIAQLAWQPFSAWLIVTVPHRILMPAMIFGWGTAEACMAACDNFGGLLACRFFLGLFEAGCMPLFTVITGLWYRRVEQPLRVSVWYSTNGLSTIVASALSYGIGHAPADVLRPWQSIFLVCGLITIVTAPLAYWKLDNDITSARFLTEHERKQGVERLRANQTGTASYDFKWSQVGELAIEPKSWLWIVMGLLANMGSTLTSIFGPLILEDFGFNKFETLLLNIPFGAVQTIVIIFSCWASYKMKLKGVILICFMVPVVTGNAMLYALGREPSDRPALLSAYYLLAFLFAGNPLLLSWVVGNTAGSTKKSTTLSLYQAGLSVGNIAGPFLFTEDQAPTYRKGVLGVLGVFIAMIASVFIQLGNLIFLNRQQRKRRIRNGKSADINDQSMKTTVNADDKAEELTYGAPATSDLTDRKNDEFVYIY